MPRIYLGALNGAREEYSDDDDREARAHKVAWAVVKKKCEENYGDRVNE